MAPVAGRLPYRPALDGIRALAVAAVLAYHAGMPWARGGFLGVDAFFVLSGFLITSLLLTEWRSRGRIDLLAFWSRRARRLLPALFLMLTGVALYALLIAQPEELDKLRGDALATIFYVANWRPVLSGQSYFDQFNIPSPLRHTWSLAIEEQYYAIWPLLVLLFVRTRHGSVGRLLKASLAMLAGSALLMALLFQPGHDPSRVYYGTDTRAQSLLAGAVLAMLLLRLGPVRGRLPMVALQVAAIACLVFLFRAWTSTSSVSVLLYRGGFLVLAAAVAVVITAAVKTEGGAVARVLSLPPLRGLGLISYGVYLWHWPLYLVLTPDRTGLDGYGLFLVRVVVTLVIATASYHLVEMPIRRGVLRRWKMSWTLAPVTAGLVAVALVLVTRGGSPSLLSTAASAPMPTPQEQPINGRLPRVMIVGDSVALSLGWGFEKEGDTLGLSIWNRAGMGCGFIDTDKELSETGEWVTENVDTCKRWRQVNWVSDVQAFDPDVVVMLFGPWDATDVFVDGKILEVGSSEWHDYARGQLQSAVDKFSSEGAKVIILTAVCYRPHNTSVAGANGRDLNDMAIGSLNDLYREYVQEHPEVSIIDLNGYMCPGGEFSDLYVDGVRLRSDGVHFTEDGAPIVASWLAPQITAVAEGQAAGG